LSRRAKAPRLLLLMQQPGPEQPAASQIQIPEELAAPRHSCSESDVERTLQTAKGIFD
jgi:hypothetical protein